MFLRAVLNRTCHLAVIRSPLFNWDFRRTLQSHLRVHLSRDGFNEAFRNKCIAEKKRFFRVYLSTVMRNRNIFQACMSSTLTLLKTWHLIGTRTGSLRGEHVEVGTGKRKREHLAAIKDPTKLYGAIRYYAPKKWPIWESQRFCVKFS